MLGNCEICISDDDSDDDEDETAALMAELNKIKQERAEEKARQVMLRRSISLPDSVAKLITFYRNKRHQKPVV